KCRNSAGETTATSTPRARTCSTASATKRPAGSSAERGYDVVKTTTFTRTRYALLRHERENGGVERVRRHADSTVAAVPLALIPTLGLAQGGYRPGAWVENARDSSPPEFAR